MKMYKQIDWIIKEVRLSLRNKSGKFTPIRDSVLKEMFFLLFYLNRKDVDIIILFLVEGNTKI
jgi:hypothetical protein